MSKWVAFYDSNGKELAAYTEAETFAGEREATTELLALSMEYSRKKSLPRR